MIHFRPWFLIAPFPKGEGRVRVLLSESLQVRSPLLNPLPLSKGRGGISALEPVTHLFALCALSAAITVWPRASAQFADICFRIGCNCSNHCPRTVASPAEPEYFEQGVDHEINASHRRRQIQESECGRHSTQIGGRLLRVAK